MKMKIAIIVCFLALSACVSKKKYKEQVSRYEEMKENYEKTKLQLDLCLSQNRTHLDSMELMQREITVLKANSNALLNQLSDLMVITREQAESIRKSLENIHSKDAYIKDLQVAMARKDSLNMALVLNLKGALKDVNDTDIDIKVEGSAVFISIADKMLFKSGSYDITSRAGEVLGKVADVLKAQPDIQFMVEGHTDNKPIRTGCIKDNWDLSVLRATSVVRALQNDFGIPATRMIASGRSEYIPVVSNDSDENRSLNRRTRIIIIPQLDQFFKLLEPKK